MEGFATRLCPVRAADDAGTVNMVTLLQVEQTLFTAEDLLAQDQLARLLAAVGLFQALGGGWPPKSGPPVQ